MDVNFPIITFHLKELKWNVDFSVSDLKINALYTVSPEYLTALQIDLTRIINKTYYSEDSEPYNIRVQGHSDGKIRVTVNGRHEENISHVFTATGRENQCRL